MDNNFCSLVVMFSLVTATEGYVKEGQLAEYCLAEAFKPVCRNDEVIVMHSARYGHIQIGRCIDEDIGRLGCYVDQLMVMDSLCSGRQSCEVLFTDSLMEGEFPCTLSKSFARYLEASFVCNKIHVPATQDECSTSGDVIATSRFNYLSSLTTEQFGCGDESKPWIIKAKEGQTINITFTDFDWKLTSRTEATVNCPVKYGYVVDETSNDIVNICGGLVRERNLFISKGNKVQILLTTSVLKNTKFMIGYKAIGCPTYKAAPNTWTEERDGYITVGCVSTKDQWKMRCIGSHWLGPLKDCSQYASHESKIEASKSQDESTMLDMPPAVAFALFGGIALVLGSIAVTAVVGVLCIRKTSKRKDQFHSVQTLNKSPLVLPLDNFATYKSVQVKLPKRKEAVKTADPFGSVSTLPSLGSMPRHPPSVRESPHYYLLEGRDTTETEPLYDVVYQGLPGEQ